MRTEFVITNPEMGIYLGNCLGLGFWSLLDPAGQDQAVSFSAPAVAQECIRNWESNPDSHPGPFEIKPVDVESPGYATAQECVAAGLPGWTVNDPV